MRLGRGCGRGQARRGRGPGTAERPRGGGRTSRESGFCARVAAVHGTGEIRVLVLRLPRRPGKAAARGLQRRCGCRVSPSSRPHLTLSTTPAHPDPETVRRRWPPGSYSMPSLGLLPRTVRPLPALSPNPLMSSVKTPGSLSMRHHSPALLVMAPATQRPLLRQPASHQPPPATDLARRTRRCARQPHVTPPTSRQPPGAVTCRATNAGGRSRRPREADVETLPGARGARSGVGRGGA